MQDKLLILFLELIQLCLLLDCFSFIFKTIERLVRNFSGHFENVIQMSMS